MKLYDLPQREGVKIKVMLQRKGKKAKEEFIIFDHLDGMYSYCTTEDGEVVHLSCGTPLKKVGNHYIIDEKN